MIQYLADTVSHSRCMCAGGITRTFSPQSAAVWLVAPTTWALQRATEVDDNRGAGTSGRCGGVCADLRARCGMDSSSWTALSGRGRTARRDAKAQR